MKNGFKIKIICLGNLIFSLVLGGCGQPSKKSVNQQGPLLETVLRQRAKNPQDVIGWLRDCSVRCEAPDKEVAATLADGYQILFSLAEKNPDFRHLTLEEKAQALLGQSKVRKAFIRILDYKTDREILETSYHELLSPNFAYDGSEQEVTKQLEATIARLKLKPETTATAWYLRAISIPANVDTLVDVMTAYKKCLDAHPGDTQCSSAYKDLVKFYERPRCRGNDFDRNTQFIGGDLNPDKKHPKKVNILGKNYFLAQQSTLAADDLLEASLESLGPDQYEIWFSLKTFSNQKLAQFTQASLKKKSSLVLSYREKVLSEAPVLQTISDGQFRMPFANSGLAKEAFEKICLKVSHDQVPDGLKLSQGL